MTKQLIKLSCVSKRYPKAKDSIEKVKELLFKRGSKQGDSEGLWVLRDISLSVARGEAFGIVGENGAGKSTLLSIIAGVLTPTFGNVIVEGKMSSLLELGVGFHKEFTGLDNIYLYGSLFGISNAEISNKVDEIINFSELGNSINRPLKEFSSGMTVRLAFSVAMAMEPDILIVDEALSVGDTHFQKKSLDAILNFKKSGGTILFASHSMYHVLHLCDNALWLKHGEPKIIDSAFKVVEAYENYMREKDNNEITPTIIPATTETTVWITHATIKKEGKEVSSIYTNDNVEIEMNICSKTPVSVHIAVGLARNDSINIYTVSTEMDGVQPITINQISEITFCIYDLGLLPGEYYFVILILDDQAFNELYKYRTNNFTVIRNSKELGIYKLRHSWQIH